MKAVLAAEIGEQIVVTLTMTKKELAQAAADPQILADAVCAVCGGKDPEPQEEAETARCREPEVSASSEEIPASEESEDISSESSAFKYRGIAFDGLIGDRETVIERVMEILIARNEIPVNMEKVESEAEYNFKAIMQRMRYDVMFGRAPQTQVDPEELMADIKEDLIHEQKEIYILNRIIEREGFEVSPEELLAEAEAMAERQETTVGMVKSFFGEDLAGLAWDVKKRKAKDFLYSLAKEGN